MRRSSISKPRNKPKIRGSSIRGIFGVRSSDISFGTKVTPENEDVKEKRRKFRDPESDHLQNSRPNACSIQYEPIQDPADAPKTSEYAFFKKLKKDAGRSDLYPLHKQDDQVKNVDINNCAREKFRTLKQIHNGFRFSVPIGKERNDDHNCFSPHVRASNSSEIINAVGPSGTNIRFPLLNQEVAPVNHNLWPSTFHGDPNYSGKQYSEKGVFCSKRQKLSQWVANTSFHKVDELYSKGFNLVNALLSRLFREDNEDNCAWEPKSNQVETDTRCQLPSFPNYDTHSRGHHWSHTNNLTESENGSYQDGGFSQYWSESRRDVILPELDNVGADSPSTSYPIETHFQCKYRIPYCNLDGRITKSLFTESNPRYHLSFEEYGPVTGHHLKDFDKFHDPNGSSVRGLPPTLLLCWDYNDEKDEQDLSISSTNTDMSLFANSRDNDHWQGHDRHIESALHSSSLFSNYFLNCSTSVALPTSASFLYTGDFGRHFKDEKYLFPKLDHHFPLTFSCNPDSTKYLNLAEDCITDNIFELSSIVCSPQDHPWSLNKVIYEKRDIDLARNHLSLLDSSTEYPLSFIHALQYPQHDGSAAAYFLGEEEKECCLYDSKRTSDFSQDALNCHDWSALNFQISGKLHSSSCGSPILERYHTEADDDNEWKFI